MDLTRHGAFVTAGTLTRTGDDLDVHRVAHLGTCDPRELTAEKLHDFLDAHGTDVQKIDLDGRTTYHQLQRLCRPHHDAKTRDDIRKIRVRKHAERAGPSP